MVDDRIVDLEDSMMVLGAGVDGGDVLYCKKDTLNNCLLQSSTLHDRYRTCGSATARLGLQGGQAYKELRIEDAVVSNISE